MFKLITCLILTGACGITGILKSRDYIFRIKELEEFKSFIRILSLEISYRKDPIPLIFQRLLGRLPQTAEAFVSNILYCMRHGNSLGECWQKAVDTIAVSAHFTEADLSVIKEAGALLGTTGVEGQLQYLSASIEKLDMQLEEARRLKLTKGKMYGGLGFAAGIVLSVLLI